MDLENMQIGSEELVAPEFEYSRPKSEYPTIGKIVEHLLMNPDKTQNIPTESLRKNGEVIQDSFEKYLTSNDYYSSSILKKAFDSPLHLYYEKESGWKDSVHKHQKDKGHFVLGTFLHECILEPTKFSRVIVEPSHPLSSNDGVKALTDFWLSIIKTQCENPEEILAELMDIETEKLPGKKAYLYRLKELSGLSAVSATDYAIINIVKSNYYRYGGGIIPRLLKHTKRECSIYGTDPATGLKVKVRPDALAFRENIGVDAVISVKSTRAESLDKFYYDSAKLKYEISEGMYQEVCTNVTGRDFNATIMLMLQTVAPYGVALLFWDPEDVEVGKFKYNHSLQTVLECKESETIPSYDAFSEEGNFGFIQMKQPDWNKKDVLPINVNS